LLLIGENVMLYKNKKGKTMKSVKILLFAIFLILFIMSVSTIELGSAKSVWHVGALIIAVIALFIPDKT